MMEVENFQQIFNIQHPRPDSMPRANPSMWGV